ncbi:hypothetical protein BG005_003259, partial [Podila minutissima]
MQLRIVPLLLAAAFAAISSHPTDDCKTYIDETTRIIAHSIGHLNFKYSPYTVLTEGATVHPYGQQVCYALDADKVKRDLNALSGVDMLLRPWKGRFISE